MDDSLPMHITLTRDQVRRVDQIAMQQFGMPGVVLMENAGRSATAVILEQIGPLDVVAVLCGGGNNGGDGYVVARHLVNAGVKVQLVCAKSANDLTGDALIHANIAVKMAIPVIRLEQLTAEHVVVDALLGTGFRGDVRENLIPYIQACDCKAMVFALDLPSGLDCDTGLACHATVKADHTITFVARKKGFNHRSAKQYTGKVHVADIGVPRDAILRAWDDSKGLI